MSMKQSANNYIFTCRYFKNPYHLSTAILGTVFHLLKSLVYKLLSDFPDREVENAFLSLESQRLGWGSKQFWLIYRYARSSEHALHSISNNALIL